MDKVEIFDQVIELLEKKLSILVESALIAKEASTNEESKAENKYDTRGLEASYLASGQSQRAQDLKQKIYQAKQVQLRDFSGEQAIGISALIELLVNNRLTKYFFLLPAGGIDLIYKNIKIQTITIEAPLGNQLVGLYEGDEFDFQNSSYEIIKVY